MGEMTPQEFLNKVLDMSREMIDFSRIDNEVEFDVGCRIVFGAMRDHGYALKKLAEKELAAHQGKGEAGARPVLPIEHISTDDEPKTVLIVDDDPDIVRYLSLWFEDNGFETLSATNGMEGLEAAAAEKPDLITLDISMPEKSGVSSYRDIKTDEDLKDIPIIIITAIGQPFNQFIRNRKKIPNPDGFIAKPIDLELLEECVQEILG